MQGVSRWIAGGPLCAGSVETDGDEEGARLARAQDREDIGAAVTGQAVETCIALIIITALGGSVFGPEGGPGREKEEKTPRSTRDRTPIGRAGRHLHLMPTCTYSLRPLLLKK